MTTIADSEDSSSFEDRRKMFKSIWDSALNVTEPADLKKKIYRYCQVEDAEKTKAAAKKERIKQLRSVCNKILKLCDNQEDNSPTRLQLQQNLKEKSSKTAEQNKRKTSHENTRRSRSSPTKEHVKPFNVEVAAWPAVDAELLPDAMPSSEQPKRKKRLRKRRMKRQIATINNITIAVPSQGTKKLIRSTRNGSRGARISTVMNQSTVSSIKKKRFKRKKKTSQLRKLAGNVIVANKKPS